MVPNIISNKDLLYLNDIFEWNFNASKKAYEYSKNIQIKSVKNIVLEVAKLHSNNCQKIIDILGGHYDK